MNQTDPVCPCCGNRWEDTRARVLVGNTFVTPRGWVALSPGQAKLVAPLTIGPHTPEQLCQHIPLVGERRLKHLESRTWDISQQFRVVGWQIAMGDMYELEQVT